MSDALADHLYAAVQAVPILPNDTQNDIDYRVYKAIAAAARAFIGDEIAARYEAAENGYESANFEYSAGFLYALDIAEQIARGDTK